MTWDNVLKLAVEWLLTKPLRERTFAAFAEIVDHFADVYVIPRDDRSGVRERYMRLPDWQKPW